MKAKSLIVVLITGMSVACGVVGAPVPPESVGVSPTIERQKKVEEEKQREAASTAETTESQPDLMLQGQDVNLPPLQPVGTR